MELGIYTFVEATPDPETGRTPAPVERIKNLMEEIELADQVGLDLFGIGEHHRPEYLSSSPAILLAAAAARTRNIRLSSAVSVLGSEDPVRLFQQFSTVDLLSEGRAEIMAGRGSFIESFPLFGYELSDYDELFAEKLELLLKLRDNVQLHWSGEHRPPLSGQSVYPRPVQNQLPVWIAVGGTPESAYRAGSLGLPMALGIIGGLPERFKPLADLHQQGARENGMEPPKLSINSHGFIGDDSERAVEDAFPAFAHTMNKIGRERGWPPMTREQFEASCSLKGANIVGSPQAVIDKILYQYELFGHQRTLLQLTVGTLSHKKVLRAIELFGTEVAPAIRKETS